jgi:hypothetical protein
MTLREVFIVLKGFNWQRTEQYKLFGWAAWHNAAMQRATKMPKLEEVIGKRKSTPKIQSPEQQKMMARNITAAFGAAKCQTRK